MATVDEDEVQRLLRYPWTILREDSPEGDVVLRVKEIPSATGSGDSEAERAADLRESLEASLRAYLHFGDDVPTPEGSAGSQPPRAPRVRLGVKPSRRRTN